MSTTLLERPLGIYLVSRPQCQLTLYKPLPAHLRETTSGYAQVACSPSLSKLPVKMETETYRATLKNKPMFRNGRGGPVRVLHHKALEACIPKVCKYLFTVKRGSWSRLDANLHRMQTYRSHSCRSRPGFVHSQVQYQP